MVKSLTALQVACTIMGGFFSVSPMRMRPAPLHLLLTWLLLCCHTHAETAPIILEGTVVAVSAVPDPDQSPYRDALFVLKLRLHDQEGATQAFLALPAFTNRTLTPFSGMQPGQLIRAMARPFLEMPIDFRETQMVDDFQDVSLELYGATEAEPIVERSQRDPANSGPAPLSAIEDLTPASLSPTETRARSARIRRDIARIEALLAPHGNWANWHASLTPIREELQRQMDASPDDYLRAGDLVLELPDFTLGFTLLDNDPRYQSVLKSFESMAREFAHAGTTLLVVPIPFRDHMVADHFVARPPADGIFAPYWLKFQHDLLLRDIEVVDLLPRYRAELGNREDIFYFHTRDGHPGTGGAILAAEAIGERLQAYAFATPRRAYGWVERYYWNREVDLFYGVHHPHRGRVVTEPDGAPLTIFDPHSEVFLFGDSMLSAPQGSHNGCISSHVVHQLGFPVQFLKQAGSAALMSAQLARQPDLSFFSKRKVAIFIFAFSFVSYDQSWWRPTPFLSNRTPSNATVRPPEFLSASGRASLTGIQAIHALARDVSQETVRVTPSKVVVESQPHPVDIEIPQALTTIPAPGWIALDLISTGPSTFHFVSPGMDLAPLPIQPGLNRLVIPLSARSEAEPEPCILRLPAHAPEFSLIHMETRWTTTLDASSKPP